MPAALTRLGRMAQNPKGDWTINDIQRVCAENGLNCTPPRGGGSHYKVSHPRDGEMLTIPARRRIKPVYIRALVGFIRKMRERHG
jgi:predicted RNA binding protein YcfA (HicA-like mRNA interferase family)